MTDDPTRENDLDEDGVDDDEETEAKAPIVVLNPAMQRVSGTRIVAIAAVLGGAVLVGAAIYGFITLYGQEGPSKGLEGVVLLVAGFVTVALLLYLGTLVLRALDMGAPGEALGMPEGSIRALIAMSLILIFAIIGIQVFAAGSAGAGLRVDGPDPGANRCPPGRRRDRRRADAPDAVPAPPAEPLQRHDPDGDDPGGPRLRPAADDDGQHPRGRGCGLLLRVAGGLAGDNDGFGRAEYHALVLAPQHHRNEARAGCRNPGGPGKRSRTSSGQPKRPMRTSIRSRRTPMRIPTAATTVTATARISMTTTPSPPRPPMARPAANRPAQQPEKPPQQPGTPGM